MDCTVHGVAKSQTRLSEFHYLALNCCRSIVQSCLTFCDPMDCSTPGFPVLHHLPELAQTHAHQVGDAVQPAHPQIGRAHV